MADDVTRHYLSSMSSISALQDTCNTDEADLERKLQSLEAVKNSDGVKVTQAKYKKDGLVGLGTLRIEPISDGENGELFDGSAFIVTVSKNLRVFREGD